MSKDTTDLRKQIHMKMLAKSDTAKDLGELTVVPLGHAVTVALALISNREKLARIDEWDYIHETMHSANIRAQMYIDEMMKDRLATLRKELDGGSDE